MVPSPSPCLFHPLPRAERKISGKLVVFCKAGMYLGIQKSGTKKKNLQRLLQRHDNVLKYIFPAYDLPSNPALQKKKK
jgi:hypothetical protein